MTSEIEHTKVEYASTDPVVLPPKCFVLATTREKIILPDNIGAFVTGRSSVGRLGLFAENAGWIDPSFNGEITLELFNGSDFPIKLEMDRRIAQILLVEVDKECENPYKGKYQNQAGATASRIYLDEEISTKE